EVHSRPGIYQKRGEFPNAQEHAIRISDDAARFYKSGKSFLLRYLPFWLASVLSRLLVAFVPTLVLLIPLVRGFLGLLKWSVNMKIRRHYRDLLLLEKRFMKEEDPVKRAQIFVEIDKIEHKIGHTKIRPAFADQFYGLRGHINYVRDMATRGSA